MKHRMLFLVLLFMPVIIHTKNYHKKNIVHDRSIWIEKKPAPWANPTIIPSDPPPTTGQQMGVVDTIGIPPLGYTVEDEIKIFHLIAQPIEKIIVDERRSTHAHLIPQENINYKIKHKHHPIYQKVRCWGYNGSSPGPTIEVTENDRIRVFLKNELPEPTSIHWHGAIVPNNQDGATPETAAPILPGETGVYEFSLKQSGTLMYHSGFNVTKQDHMGLQGMFVIHPKKYDKPIDKQYAIMLSQTSILPGNEYNNLMTKDFNWFTFNGVASPNIPTITVRQADRVRIRFGNLIMDSHPIHIHGFVWDWVGTEGGPLPFPIKGSTINVPPGTTRDVEFVANNPGLWRLHCHKLHHIMNTHAEVPMGIMPHGGMFTLIKVLPSETLTS